MWSLNTFTSFLWSIIRTPTHGLHVAFYWNRVEINHCCAILLYYLKIKRIKIPGTLLLSKTRTCDTCDVTSLITKTEVKHAFWLVSYCLLFVKELIVTKAGKLTKVVCNRVTKEYYPRWDDKLLVQTKIFFLNEKTLQWFPPFDCTESCWKDFYKVKCSVGAYFLPCGSIIFFIWLKPAIRRNVLNIRNVGIT